MTATDAGVEMESVAGETNTTADNVVSKDAETEIDADSSDKKEEEMSYASIVIAVVGTVFLAILAITDFVSDVKLYIDIKETLDLYEDDLNLVKTIKEQDDYEYEYCIPSNTQPVLSNQVHAGCDCLDVMVSCDSTSNPIINLKQNNTSTSSEYSFVSEMVESSVSCEPILWGEGYSFAWTYQYTNWTCSHCECSGNLYDVNSSFAMMEVQSQYGALNDKQSTYCNIDHLVDSDHSDQLNDLMIVCAVFIGIGALVQCCTLCCTLGISLAIVLGTINMTESSNEAGMAIVQLMLTFFLGILEDVPQTIVAMLYLKFLHMDTGYFCYHEFATYPQLTMMDIDPADSIVIILFENPSIAFAVVMSLIMIVVSGTRLGWKLVAAANREFKVDSHLVKVTSLLIVAVVPLMYVLDLLMPIAAVSYYDVAPEFDKEWMPAFILFIFGCVSWGLTFCICCCALLC